MQSTYMQNEQLYWQNKYAILIVGMVAVMWVYIRMHLSLILYKLQMSAMCYND